MKKIYFCLLLVLGGFVNELLAQTTVTIPAANTAGTGANTTTHRKPYGTSRAYERSAMKYTHSEIGMMGNITAIGFYCDTVNNPGKAPVKIYIKEVVDSTFTASTVAAEETGATLVYQDTIMPASFVKNQWTMVTLTTPFAHVTTNNIEVIIETNSQGTVGTDGTTLSKGFRYSTPPTNARMEIWQSATGSSVTPTGTGTVVTTTRSNVQFTLVPAAACTAPPTAGTTIATATTACSGNTVGLSLNGNSSGTGQTYQWLSSPDGINWTPISGATTPAYNATITATTYYSCVVTCSAQSATSSFVMVTMNPFYMCYCTAGIGGGCTTQATAIDSVAINGTTLQNGLTGCSSNNYTMYPASGNTTATLNQGQAYTMVTKYTGNCKTSMWIDYNQNGIFENTEWKQICLTSTAGTNVTSSFAIPMSALTGVTGMRIRSRSSAGTNDSTMACTTFGTGETEDYIITIGASVTCSAPPTAGTAVATTPSVCAGAQVTLSLNGTSTGSGLTYQWLSSPNGTTWTQVAGATGTSLTTTISATTYFACEVTCSAQSDISTSVLVSLKPFYNCYCVQGIGGGCTTTAIDSVAIGTTTLANGLTGCSTNNYTVYPASGNTTATLLTNMTYTMYTKFLGAANCSMWIDYNQNGLFDTNEWTQVCTTTTAGALVTSTFSVPSSALTGLTGMRLRSRSTAGANDSTTSCTTFGSGETEDYLVTITTGTGGIKENAVSQLYVFPNPSNGIVNVALTSSSSQITFQVVSLAGDVVYSESTAAVNGTTVKSLNLSSLSKGIYFIRVGTDKGYVMKKVVLQ